MTSHLSIGDVLSELRDEFPDITISKIRFLESQGLIEPERTPSGYRKFAPTDVARLQWILQQQKEHFLPLKVIKDRLDEVGPGAIPTDDATPAASAASATPTRRPRRARPVDDVDTAAIVDDDAPDDLAVSTSGASLTRPELAAAAGLSEEDIAHLEEYGLVSPVSTVRNRPLFDEDALAVARYAGGFMRHGIEPRHLRMYLAFAEREATLFDQVLLPYRRQRNPESRARAEEVLGELATLGRQLRTALLRQAVHRAPG
ncbi:MAG TPA: MerR family transcriptional regulator [Acidimicrobiia bacterium]|nr:MerR family transcriptional regulator [Acidimicrobiia bacterium]